MRDWDEHDVAGTARDHGPPRPNARQLVTAIAPVLELTSLTSAEFRDHHARAWICASRRRTVPAQPPTGR